MSIRRTHILIVDDEPNIRLMLRTALEADGHEVTEASNGREALDRIEQDVPGLMILDLSMPVMDGMLVLDRLSEMPAGRKPPVIVLTAYGSIPAAVKAMRLGARDFIEKPTTPDDLREVVQQALSEPAPADAPRPREPGYDDVLQQVREALREGELRDAESLLMKAGSITTDDAAFLNLTGVFHEAMGRPDAAKRFYGKAIRVNRSYEPAQQNMRRLYELATLGHSVQSVALGSQMLDSVSVHAPPSERLVDRLRKLLALKT